MKTLTIILSLIISSLALAEEPAELVKLRATYDNSLRSDFQKVGKLYHGRLVELKKSYMEAQNLEAAVAVDAEIKKLRETHGRMVVIAPSPLDGVWFECWSNIRVLRVFRGDKMINVWKNNNLNSIFSVENDLITIQQDDGFWWRLKMDANNPDILVGERKDGKKVTFERHKW